MRPVEVSKSPDERGVREIEDLVRVVTLATGHPPLGEQSLLRLGATGVVSLAVRSERDSRLLAYGQLTPVGDGWALELAVDPSAAGDAVAIRLELVARALVEASGHGGGPVQVFVPQATEEDDAWARAAGLEPSRRLVQMRRSLPLETELDAAADNVTVRGFRTGADEERFLALNNAAFANHPEQGAWDDEALSLREAEPWFDPRGLLLAEEAGALVGACWTKVAPDPRSGADPGALRADVSPVHAGWRAGLVGEIYVVAVAPSHQGAGLGRALVAAGCRYLAERGLAAVSLYVDATNEPAMRLYRRLGFTIDHADRVYAARRQVGRR